MTQVLIDDVLPRTQAIAVGSQTVYSTDWTADAASDVLVYSRAAGVDADDATQQLATNQYSVAFIGAERIVQVTLITPSTAGDIVTIVRNTPADRMNLYVNTNFTPSMLNNDFGILTLVDQQAQLVNQLVGPRYNYSAVIVPLVDTILPVLGANEFWGKNASGTEIIAIDIASIVGGGTVTQINTGLGLTGGPIVSTGTIAFADMDANTFWGNITSAINAPSQVSTSYFVKATDIGVTVEAWSPALDSIAGLTTVANEMLYLTAPDTYDVISAAANSVLVTSSGSVPSLSQTLPSAVQLNITKLGTQSQALNMGSHLISNVTDPVSAQDAATMAYVTAQTTGVFLPLIGGTMSGIINMGNHKITNMTDPSAPQDAVTVTYLDAQLMNYLSLSGGTMTGAINMGSHFITNLLDPLNPQDAATRAYVDSVATGLNIQPAVYAATTANLTALYFNGASGIGATLTNSGALAQFTVDGTTPPTNARILVPFQSSTLENGIYTLTNQGSGAVAWILTRATDYDQPAEVTPGDLVVVNNGTAYGGSSFIETASVSAIGTDPILFSQFTFSATAVLLKANNLSDVASTVTAFNNISPSTTKGDLIVNDGTNDVRLAVGGTNGQLLQVKSSTSTGLVWTTATYPETTTVNQILYSSATNTIGGISSLAGGVLVTDNLSVPQFLTNPGATGKMLLSANAAIPSWSTSTIPTSAGATANKVLLSDGTNYVLSIPTFPNASATLRKIIISDGTNWTASTETYAAPGTSGNVLTSDGTNWISAVPASTALLTTKGDLFGFSTVDARVPVASGNGKVLQVDSTASVGLSYSTPTYPSASGSAGKILRSDGTNNDYTTSTFADTYAVSTLLYASSANTIVGLATVNSAMLTTDSGGVPSWVASTGSGAPVRATSPTLVTPILGVAAATSVAFGGGTALSNYLESTWTPVVTLVGGAGNTVPVYTTNSGSYTRIGNVVFCVVTLVGDGGAEGAGTGAINISLPITSSALNNGGSVGVNGAALNNTTRYQLFTVIAGGVTTATIFYWNSLTTFTQLTGADQNNTTRSLILQFYYFV